MSENNQGNSTPENQDPLKNIKAELDRKLGNTSSELAELKRTNEALIAQMAELSKKVAPASTSQPQEDLSTLFYQNPERYAQIVAERAAEKADKVARQREEVMRKTNSTLSQLQSDFPELGDSNSELTRKAVEIYNSLPDDEKNSSMAYKLSVQSAAVELGVKPRSKRPVDDEPTGAATYNRGSNRRSNKLDPATEELASIFGIDTSKPEVKERMVQRAQRNWSKFDTPIKKR